MSTHVPRSSTIIAGIATVLATGLMLVNVAGSVMEPSDAYARGTTQKQGIAGYDYPTIDTGALKTLLERPVIRFDLAEVNEVVSGALIHSDARRIGVLENWLLWLGGKFYEPLSHTQDPVRLVRGGAALCGEAAAVLNAIADLNDHDSRLLALSGHMVSEVRTSDGWRVADPDYGVVYPVGLGALQEPAGAALMRDALAARGFDQEEIENYVRIVQSAEDNAVLAVGAPSSPRLYRAEVAAEYLKWAIPILILFVAIAWRWSSHSRKS